MASNDEKPATNKDVESGRSKTSLGHFRMIWDQGVLTPEMQNHNYEGSGTEDDPYVVVWIPNDPRNPMQWSFGYKWFCTLAMAFSVLAVSLNSSMYSGAANQLVEAFHVSEEVIILGLSLFVVGFALGPLFWAPLSEMYGRQVLFFGTFAFFSFFNAGVCASQNIWTIIILRFFAGSFGSSPLANAGGVIADMFEARHRGLALSVFAAAPFLGPSLGPIIGGFLGEAAGWRWVMGFMAAFSGLAWFVGSALVPETYAPVLLRQRARKLSKLTGKVYTSKLDVQQGKPSLGEALKVALTRPWVLLLREPIVLIMSIYMAIIYGTLYMLFSAFPIVYQDGRGWSQGIGGLSFLGVLIGMVMAVVYNIFIENPRYQKLVDKTGKGYAEPEARLPPTILGGILLPIGLFWFAWTNSPSLPWAASMAAGIPFGFGMVLVFLSIMNYLIDSYTIFAASCLAANAVLRSIFGAVFPLFTTYMYDGLGIHWASSIPAFLALACVPFPFLFYKYGAAVRARCKFAKEAEMFLKRVRGEIADGDEDEAEASLEVQEKEETALRNASVSSGSPGKEHDMGSDENSVENLPQLEGIRTGRSAKTIREEEWADNPFVVDRVHTRESFKSRKERSGSRSAVGSRGASQGNSRASSSHRR